MLDRFRPVRVATAAESVALTASRTVFFNPGDSFSIRVSTRIDEGTGHSSGRLQIQFDAVSRSTNLMVNFGTGDRTFFLHENPHENDGLMNTTDNTGDTTVNLITKLASKAGGNPWVVMGTWSGTVSSPLQAAAAPPNSLASNEWLAQQAVQPIFQEAVAHWEAAGVNAEQLGQLRGLKVSIGNLGGILLGLTDGATIWLDDNAAGWGWFVDPTPWNDSAFTTPGNQGEKHYMDLLTVLVHELGHVLGYEHSEEGVMEESLAAGTRRLPGDNSLADYPALLDQVFAAERGWEGDLVAALLRVDKNARSGISGSF